MPWAEIIAAAIALIAECRKSETEEAIFQRMREGGLHARYCIRQIGRERGLVGQKLRKFVRDAEDHLDDASDEELQELIVKARSFPL